MVTRSRVCGLIVLIGVFSGSSGDSEAKESGPSRASRAAAKAHEQKAGIFFEQHAFAHAIDELEEANRLDPHPEYLFNIAGSYRKLYQQQRSIDNYKKAIDYYERYLAADPHGERVNEVRANIEAIKKLIDEEPVPPPAPATPTPATPIVAKPAEPVSKPTRDQPVSDTPSATPPTAAPPTAEKQPQSARAVAIVPSRESTAPVVSPKAPAQTALAQPSEALGAPSGPSASPSPTPPSVLVSREPAPDVLQTDRSGGATKRRRLMILGGVSLALAVTSFALALVSVAEYHSLENDAHASLVTLSADAGGSYTSQQSAWFSSPTCTVPGNPPKDDAATYAGQCNSAQTWAGAATGFLVGAGTFAVVGIVTLIVASRSPPQGEQVLTFHPRIRSVSPHVSSTGGGLNAVFDF